MRLRRDAKIELIRKVPLFSHCSKKELAAIASLADEVSLKSGTKLTREGETGREFVVIADGAADVTKNGRRINKLGAGDFVGEIALLSGKPRTATVTTTEDSRVLVLTDRAFRRLTRELPSVQASIVTALSERLHADAI
jgi:CRP/FNR family cyclic AMP-dependent transcriptional regulator